MAVAEAMRTEEFDIDREDAAPLVLYSVATAAIMTPLAIEWGTSWAFTDPIYSAWGLDLSIGLTIALITSLVITMTNELDPGQYEDLEYLGILVAVFLPVLVELVEPINALVVQTHWMLGILFTLISVSVAFWIAHAK